MYDRALQRQHVASPPSSPHLCPSLSHNSLCRQLHRRTGSSSEPNPMTWGSSPSHVTDRHPENVPRFASSRTRGRYPCSHAQRPRRTFCAQHFCNVTTVSFCRTDDLRRPQKVGHMSGVCNWRQRCVYLAGTLRADWSVVTKMKLNLVCSYLSDSVLCLRPRSGEKWPATLSYKPDGAKDRVADIWRLHLEEADTQYPELRTPFQEELRTIIAVSQLNIYGEVADWCHQELTQRIEPPPSPST